MWVDIYSDKYQKINGVKIKIETDNADNMTAYLSLKISTRSVYDLAMRENFIDGLITMDNIDEKLKPSQMFYFEQHPNIRYILQSVNLAEHQPQSRSINAVRQNSEIRVERFGFADEMATKRTWNVIYESIPSFVSDMLKDGKNFNSGVEDNTVSGIQIPKFDKSNNFYQIEVGDRIVITNIYTNEKEKIHCESVDSFGVRGITRIQGVLDMRSDDGVS